LFTTSASAQEAINKLHAHVFKGSLLSVTLKKRLDSLSKAPSKKVSTSTKTSAPNRASRLIVRNLPFNITEQDLRAVFLPYGPIHSINIPTAEGGEDGKKARAKGFAFVWMLSKKDAEKALECNGMAVRAGMADGLVMDKQKKKKVRREEKKKEATKVEDGEAGAVNQAKDAEERVIAVDWALSKDKWEQEQPKMDVDDEGDVDIESVKSEEDGGSASEESDEDEDGNLGVHEDSGDEDASEEGDDDIRAEGGEQQVKPQLPPPETGTTLFIRNVPFAATEDELRTLYGFYSVFSSFFISEGTCYPVSVPSGLCDMPESPWILPRDARAELVSHASGIRQTLIKWSSKVTFYSQKLWVVTLFVFYFFFR
jgi:nucleolar protein 4